MGTVADLLNSLPDEDSAPTAPVAESASPSRSLVDDYLDRAGVDDPTVRERINRLAMIESSGGKNLIGPKVARGANAGDQARGLLQIMPKTFAEVNPAGDVNDMDQANEAGINYFLNNLKRYNGDLDLATIAHHAGHGGVQKYQAGALDTDDGQMSTLDYLDQVRGNKAPRPTPQQDQMALRQRDELPGNQWLSDDPVIPEKEEGMGSAFIRNAKKTLPQTKQLLSGAGALAADTLGMEGVRDYLMESYKSGEEATADLTRPTDTWSEGGKDNLGKFIAGSAGYFTGQIIESIGVALAAGAAGSAAGGAGAVPAALGGVLLKTEAKEAIKFATKELIEAQVKKGIAEGLTKEAALKAAETVAADFAKTLTRKAVGKELAIGGAMVGQGVGMETGEIYGELFTQAQKEGREVTDEERGRAWLYGGLAGSVDGIVNKYNLDAVIGGGAKGAGIRQRLMGVLREGAKAEAREVPTEIAQTGLERAGKGQEWRPSDPDAAKEYIDTAAMTAAGAWIPGVGGARVDAAQSAPVVEKKPDSPLTNAANAGQAAQVQAAQDAVGETGAAEPSVNAMLASLRETMTPEVFAQVGQTQGAGPEAEKQLRSAWNIANDTRRDEATRRNAIYFAAQMLDSLGKAPNWTTPQGDAQAMPGNRLLTDSSQDTVIDGQATRIPDGDGVVNDVPGLASPESMATKRDAEAAYEQAFADLMKAEALGANDPALQQAQQNARMAESRLHDITTAIDGNRAAQTAANRRRVLDQVLADPAIADHAKAFRSALVREGRNDADTITPDETARIDRFKSAKSAFEQDYPAKVETQAEAPDVVPSTPNEMPADLVPGREDKEAKRAAQQKRIAEAKERFNKSQEKKHGAVVAGAGPVERVGDGPTGGRSADTSGTGNTIRPAGDHGREVPEPSGVGSANNGQGNELPVSGEHGVPGDDHGELRGPVTEAPAKKNVSDNTKDISSAISLADRLGLKGMERKDHVADTLSSKWGMTHDEIIDHPDVVSALKKPPSKSDRTAANERAVDKILQSAERIASEERLPKAEVGAPGTAAPKQSTIDKAADAIDAKIDDVAARLAAKLKEKRGTLNAGVDPELLMLGAELGALYISKGVVKFAQYSAAIIDKMKSLGIESDEIKPMLKEFYLATQAKVDDATFDQMDDARAVRKFDINSLVPVQEAIAAAEKITDTNPSAAQKEAENYRKGKFDWNGLTVAVETPKGAERTDKETNGEKWRVTMPATYGYFLGTVGADKDHVDVFVGEHPESNHVYIIDQNRVDSQSFDEHKVMIGYRSEQDAVADYLLSFSGTFGNRVFGQISDAITPEQLKSTLPKLAKRTPYTEVPAQEFNFVEPAPGAARKPLEKVVDNTASAPAAPQERAYTKDAADKHAKRLTQQGYPSEAYPHPTQPGLFAIRAASGEAESKAPKKAPAEVAGETARRGEYNVNWTSGNRNRVSVLENAERGGFTVREVGASFGSRADVIGTFKMDDNGNVSSVKPRFDWALTPVSDASEQFSAEQRSAQKAPEGQTVAEPKGWRKSWTKAKEYAEALGVPVRNDKDKFKKSAELVADIEAHLAGATVKDSLTTEKAEQDAAPRILPGYPGYTLEMAEADLDDLHKNTGEKWFAQDDRLTERIKRQEKLIAEMKVEAKLSDEEAKTPAADQLAPLDGKPSKADVMRELAKINEQMPEGFEAFDGALGIGLALDGKPLGNLQGLSRVNGYEELLRHAKLLAKVSETKEAPGTRINTPADKAIADRLDKIADGLAGNGKPVAHGAYLALRSSAEELRKKKTVTSVPEILETASQRLFSAGFPVQSEVIDEIVEQVREGLPSAESKLSLENQNVSDNTDVKEIKNHEQTGNGGNGESPLAPVSPGIVQGTEGERDAGTGSGRLRGPDAARNGGVDAVLRDDQRGSVDGEPDTLLSERPVESVEIEGVTRPLEEVAERVKHDNPASEPKGAVLTGNNPGNYVITDDDRIGTGTAGERIRNNLAAVRLVLDLEREQRYATTAEQAVLVKYVGWGGLKNVFKPDSDSKQEREALAELKRLLTDQQLFWMGQTVLDAHYTSPKIIRAMYKIIRHMGVSGGRFLEPTVGSGNFIGLMPSDMAASSKWFASEIDPITSLIAKHAYPESQVLTGTGFQEAEFAYGRFDVAIGNPPFGDQRITDTNPKRAEISGQKIHNYVISKSAMHLRPGGVMAMVVTSRFLDTANPEARDFLAKSFRFLGALRMPNNAFKDSAGTEVTTDIIFLQKLRDGQREGIDSWLDTKGRMLNEDGETVTLNRYFAEHPEHMFGKPSMQGTMYGSRTEKGEFALQAIDGLDAEAKLDELLAMPDHSFGGLKNIARKRPEDADAQAAEVMLNREDVPTGGFFRDGERILERMDDDDAGNAVFRELTPETPWTEKQTLGKKKLARIKGILSLRDDAYALMAAERADAPVDRLDAMRAQLNVDYDAFVSEHGFLNSAENVRLFSDDARIEFGLESEYRKAISPTVAKKTGFEAAPESAKKSALLVERVFYPTVEIEHADTPRDGYSVSLSQRGKLDIDYIAELTNQSADEVIADLSSGDSPLIFRNPEDGQWVQEDEYLSGNVKAKLKEAKAAGMAANVKALEAVQPADVAPAEVHAEFGAPWVPVSIYEDFLKLLGYASAKVVALPKSGLIQVGAVGQKVASPFAVDLENPDYTTEQVFAAVANRKPLIATDSIGDGKREVNHERTKNLKRISGKLLAIWNDWVKADDARADLLAKDYNEKMNTTVERKFDGVTQLRTVGANPTTQLRNTQKNAAWRMIQSPILLMDHVVGAGKTMSVITGLMERARLGLSRKPMVIVPNHLVGQWSRDWMQLYPGANILAATEKDFSKNNRRRLFARIATGKYDAVIVGHSSFGHIPVSSEAETDFLMGEVKHLQGALEEAERAASESGKKDTRTVRAIKNRIAKRLEKIKELQAKPRDNVATFEDMGIDYLAVDEAHEFKNLEYSTTLTNVAGMGSPEGSKKAFDLYMKVQLTAQRDGGIAFASGTPLSNSMVEMYTILRYLNPTALAERYIQQFDAWAKTFASIESRDEYTAAGKIKARTVMASFNNLPELLQIYKQVADTVTMSDLKRLYAEQMRAENLAKGTNEPEEFPVPKVKGGTRRLDIAAPTERQIEYMDYLMARADVMDDLKGKDKQEYAKIDNALWLMNDARKMSLDVRTSDPTAPDEPGNKVNRAAKQIKATYDRWSKDRGTQLVFCDLSTPGKVATKDAKAFIKKALEKLGMDKDAGLLLALEDKSYEDKWLLLADRADQMLDSGTLKDAVRERIEDFIENVNQEDMGALLTADSGFSVYDALKTKLIESGVPEREIAFIHDAATADKKRELFDLVNAGKVRVLIGSSQKMGAGMNVQERVVALHHMDAPWRPSDMEQREGRVIRQKNKLYKRDPKGFEVEIVAYSTERTFDAQMWAVLARKAGFLEQFRAGHRSIKEETSDAAGYAEFMAQSTGNPIFREKIVLEREIDDLEAEDRSSRMKLDAARRTIESADMRRQGLIESLAAVSPLAGTPITSVTFEGKSYTNDLAAVLASEMDMYRKETADYEVAHAAYVVARAEWEAKGVGSDRGRPPSLPAKPEYPETTSARLREKSEWARLIGDLMLRMSVVADGAGGRRFSLTLPSGQLITLEASPSRYIEGEIELSIDGVGHIGQGKPAGTRLPQLLRANALTGAFQSAESDYTLRLKSLETGLAQAQLTLDRIKLVDPERITAAQQRYAEVVAEVDAIAAQLATERAGKQNRFVDRDKARFPNGIKQPAPDATPSVLRQSRRPDVMEFPGGIDAPTANAVVARLVHALGAATHYQTVQSFFELPQEVQADARAQGSDEKTTKGVLHKGTLYLVANNAQSIKDIEQTVFHELIGHAGMRKLLGPEFVQKMNALFVQLGGVNGLSKIAAENEFGPVFAEYVQGIAKARGENSARFTDAIAKFIMTEEVFAHMAEKAPTIYQKAKALVGWVRDWLRRHGFAKLSEFGETDILHLLNRARAALRDPNGNGPKGGIAPAVVSRSPADPVGQAHADGVDFANDFLTELSYEDEAFRYAISKSHTLEGNILAALPSAEYLGEDTRPDERDESMADRRDVFALGNGTLFYVYSRGKEVWIDVSRLRTGDQGSAIYHGVANFAHNTGKVFVGDPLGLSEDAIVRRTSNMLSSALRFGTTAHLGASPEQVRGLPEKGIEPLDWTGDDLAKTKALIHTFITTLQNQFPGIKDYRYDAGRNRFIDRGGRPLDAARLDYGTRTAGGRASRTGEASLRRGILIQSLVSSQSSEKPGLLENVLSRSVQLVDSTDGLAAVLRRSPAEALRDFAGTPEGRKKITQRVMDLFSGDSLKTFNLLHRTVSSQFHKAKIDRDFGRVVDRAQSFIDDVARYGAEASDLAPDILPKMDTIGTAFREAKNFWRDKEDAKAIAAPIFEGTLYEDAAGNHGKVWSDDELRTQFSLNERQIGLYRQFRQSVDHSLEQLAVAEMNKIAKVNELEMPSGDMGMRELSDFYSAQFGGPLRDLQSKLEKLKKDALGSKDALLENAVANHAGREKFHEMMKTLEDEQQAEQAKLMKEIESLQAMWDGIVGKKNTILKLQREGYAPLMRFGEFTVDVVEQVPSLDENGKPRIDKATGEIKMEEKRHFFGMFETQRAAKEAAAALAQDYPEATVTTGVTSQDGYQLFGSVSTDSLEMVARLAGNENEAVQKYYKEAVASRSALKRLIHRQGIAGYSDDVSRTLASFLLSNARATASAKHFGDLVKAAADIPKEKGDVKDEAVKLINYIRNPNEEAGWLRGLLFTQFLGGSVASAAVNLTQTIMTTLPYMAQYGGTPADLFNAANLARRRFGKVETTGDSVLDAALTRAENEGVVSPHNIHAMMGATQAQGAMRHRGVRLMSHIWGSFFGMAEQFNRETAFIAAFQRAEAMGRDGMQAAYEQHAAMNQKRGLPAPDYKHFASSFGFAKNAVNETQFVLSKAARPNFARGPIGATLMTFKQFSIFYIELMKRLPNRERAIMLATLMIMAGTAGLPGSDDLDDLVDTIGQAMGYNTNSQRSREQFLKMVFGKMGGEFVINGISAFLPLQLQSRLGMGNLLPATAAMKKSSSGKRTEQAIELLGVAGGYYKQLSDAWDYTLQERYGMAATQGFLPKAAKDVFKAIDMARRGTYDDTHGRRVADVSLFDAFIKAIGFQPIDVANIQGAKGLMYQDVALVRTVKSSIAEVWAQGIHDKDKDKIDMAKRLRDEWNQKNPEVKITINMGGVMRRANQMSKSAGERMLNATPKDMRKQVADALSND